MKIETPFPENIDDEDLPLFRGKEVYHVNPLKLNEHKNVFITHQGLCFKNFLLLKNSHFNLRGSADTTFYRSFYKLALEQYLVSTYGKSLKKINLASGKYLHIHTKWFGYFFWLTDALPKLIKTQPIHESVTLIYPESWSKVPFVNQTLALFPNLKIEKIPVGVHMQLSNVVIPETRQWSNAIDPAEIKLVQKFLDQKLTETAVNLNLGELIFISRGKAARRKPANNDAVEKVIHKEGFKSVCLEDYTFLEQMSIVKNASFVIGLHGAGLANIIMLAKSSVLLELSPKITDSRRLRIPFWRLANAVGAKYFIQFCDVQSTNATDIYDENLIIDVNLLQKNIQYIKGQLDS